MLKFAIGICFIITCYKLNDYISIKFCGSQKLERIVPITIYIIEILMWTKIMTLVI